MKTEDTEDTLKMMRAVGGTGQYAEQVRMDRTGMGSYQDVDTVEFRERDNIQLSELKSLQSGEGIIVFEDRLVRSNSIYIPDKEKISKLDVKINRYVPLRRPEFSDLCREFPSAERRRPVSQDNVSRILNICQTREPHEWGSRQSTRIADKTLIALTALASDLDNRCDVAYSPEERGILMFETVIEALKETGGRYRWLKEQENIRISKKRIEEAHQNNTSVQGAPESSQSQRAPSPPTAHYDTQDAYYDNLADQSFADDFDNTTEHLTY